MKDVNDIWSEPFSADFAEKLVAINESSLMRAFLRDLMTESELREIGARLRAAQMLSEGQTYKAIVCETKLSSRTVARISDWMQRGAGGYTAVLSDIHHIHSSPARAE